MGVIVYVFLSYEAMLENQYCFEITVLPLVEKYAKKWRFAEGICDEKGWFSKARTVSIMRLVFPSEFLRWFSWMWYGGYNVRRIGLMLKLLCAVLAKNEGRNSGVRIWPKMNWGISVVFKWFLLYRILWNYGISVMLCQKWKACWVFGEWSSVMKERKNVTCFPVPSFGVPVVSFDPWLGWKSFRKSRCLVPWAVSAPCLSVVGMLVPKY